MLTARQARRVLAQHTGLTVPRSTFYRWLDEGLILTVRLNKTLRVPSTALAKFLTLRCEENDPDPFAGMTPSDREAATEHNRAMFEILQAEIAAPEGEP